MGVGSSVIVCGSCPPAELTPRPARGARRVRGAGRLPAGRRRRPADPELLAHTFWGSVHEYVMAELFESGGPQRQPVEGYLRGVIDLLLEGLIRRDGPGGGSRRTRR